MFKIEQRKGSTCNLHKRHQDFSTDSEPIIKSTFEILVPSGQDRTKEVKIELLLKQTTMIIWIILFEHDMKMASPSSRVESN